MKILVTGHKGFIGSNLYRYLKHLGYDVDGRGDISWSNTFSKRLKIKLEQLLEYEKSIKEILKISKKKVEFNYSCVNFSF